MRFTKITFIAVVLISLLVNPGVSYGAATAYKNEAVNGVNLRYVTVDMSNDGIRPVILNAQNKITETEPLAAMAQKVGAVAAINGTYFEAYEGVPIPWGTIIKEGKVIHISQSGAVVGITAAGKLLVDRLTFDFAGYINGQNRAIPWRINHPSVEDDAITIFTPEYGATVTLAPGAKAAVVGKNGLVAQIATADFDVPGGGFAIAYNPAVAYLVGERYKVGDHVTYDVTINTTFTSAKDWQDVTVALGAGPSLIINGVITADGPKEGFIEEKINSLSTARSFIGATAEGKIIIGNMASATVSKAAEVCQSLGLVNAMCLDGGGSTALYYPANKVSYAGRNVNNGLAFLQANVANQDSRADLPDQLYAKPSASKVYVNGSSVDFTAYNISGNNYFKLRDLALALKGSGKQFDVGWDQASNSIILYSNQAYKTMDGESPAQPGQSSQGAIPARKTSSKILAADKAIVFDAYNINGNNFFRLRDIAELLDFELAWDAAAGAIRIDTAKSYRR